MSYPAILSALRELILDRRNLPATKDERLILYSARFSELSLEEAEDLAKIPPDRIAIYTRSIFASQRNLLRRRFPATFAVLERLSEEKKKARLDGFALCRDMHEVLPWKGNQTETLFSNFVEFITDHPLIKGEEWLRDVAEVERTNFMLSRAPASMKRERRNLRPLLLKSTVGLVLESPFRLTAPLSLIELEHDIVGFLHSFDLDRKTAAPPKRHVYGIGSRSVDFKLFWTEISRGEHALFSSILISERQPDLKLQDLAESFSEGVTYSSEEELFRVFLERALCFEERGIIELY